jgi:uncharacterized protein (TIGR03435 family)
MIATDVRPALLSSIVLLALPFIGGVTGPAQSRAQSASPRPTFEVASIRLDISCDNGGGPGGISPGRINLKCITLRALIRTAYSAFVGATLNSRRTDVVGGPNWLDTDRYDISAKSGDNAPPAQMMGPMLQGLLEDRFGVKVHREARLASVYALTMANNNLRLPPSAQGNCTPMNLDNLQRSTVRPDGPAIKYCGSGGLKVNGTRSVADWYGVTMEELAGRALSMYVDRPVIDKTGLTGRFDVHLEFLHDRSASGPTYLNGVIADDPSVSTDEATPSIFTALEKQLGLKLSPGKAPLETIVIDRAETPSEN